MPKFTLVVEDDSDGKLRATVEFEPELRVGVPLTPAQRIGNGIAAALLELGEALPVAEEPDEA